MKAKTVGIAFFVLLLLSLFIFLQTLIRTERHASKEELFNRGDYLVSLLCLHSIKDFEGVKRDLLIKTLLESDFHQQIAYCFIHDRDGKPRVSLALHQIASEIPYSIQLNSLAAMGLVRQFFKPIESKIGIYEFAKPMYEKGEKTGTVRIGFREPSISIFSAEKVTLLGIIAFFIVAAAVLSYYGFVKAFQPLENFLTGIVGDRSCSGDILPNSFPRNIGIEPMMQECKKSIMELKGRLDEVDAKNTDLSCQLAVMRFGKDQASHVLNSLNAGIVVTDIHENIGFINDYMLNLLKKKRNEVVDSPLEQVISDTKFLAFISRASAVQGPSVNEHLDMSFPGPAPDKSYEVSCTYLTNGHKGPIGKLIVFENTTREKKSAQAINEFTSHVAHELLTPLTNIKSYSEMLMDGEILDIATQKEFYNVINNETDRLSGLVKDLLNLSQIEIGALVPKFGRVMSDWLVEGCIETVAGAARNKNIAILRKVPDNFPVLIGDKELLKGAVINILGNAIKYTPENGQVELELYEDEKVVTIDIRDNGYGISPEDLPHIFEKFYRSGNPEIKSQRGTGLGLAITSQIIGLHGGEIKVESDIDKGTCFTVRIPKKEDYLV